jgi:biotin carboxyl carrier protein
MDAEPLVNASGEQSAASSPLGFRLVVAPASGRVGYLPPAQFHDGDEWVTAGQVVAVIEQGANSVEVKAPVDGRLGGLLVRDGTPVVPGQPLLFLDGLSRQPGAQGRTAR